MITCIKQLCLLQTLPLLNLKDRNIHQLFLQQQFITSLLCFCTYVYCMYCMCVRTWISILVYVRISSHGVSKTGRHVAGRPFALQDLWDKTEGWINTQHASCDSRIFCFCSSELFSCWISPVDQTATWSKWAAWCFFNGLKIMTDFYRHWCKLLWLKLWM